MKDVYELQSPFWLFVMSIVNRFYLSFYTLFASKNLQVKAETKHAKNVDYSNKENSITFRKSVGKVDNSGNYNEYSNIKETASDKLTITLKGNSDSYNLAI